MPQYSADAVSRFEEVLRKDPNSQVFAPLADVYRTEARLAEADWISSEGVRRHPGFAGGWVVRGRVMRDMKKPLDAEQAFRKAVQLAPENLLALQQLGEILLENKNAKEALRLFKRVLFLNPGAEKARRIVAKLESLTADEYGEELFAMTKLKPLEGKKSAAPAPAAAPGELSGGLVRMLSLVDAFIVRNDLIRAGQLVDETRVEFGDHPEIQQRALLLQKRKASMLSHATETPEPLAPVRNREESARRRKIETLHALLRTIESYKDAPLTS